MQCEKPLPTSKLAASANFCGARSCRDASKDPESNGRVILQHEKEQREAERKAEREAMRLIRRVMDGLIGDVERISAQQAKAEAKAARPPKPKPKPAAPPKPPKPPKPKLVWKPLITKHALPASVAEHMANPEAMRLRALASPVAFSLASTPPAPAPAAESSSAARVAHQRLADLQAAEAKLREQREQLAREQLEAERAEAARAERTKTEREAAEREAAERDATERAALLAERCVRVRLRGSTDLIRHPDEALAPPPPGCRIYHRALKRANCLLAEPELTTRCLSGGENIRAGQSDGKRKQVDLTYEDKIACELHAVLQATGELDGRNPVEWRALHSQSRCKKQRLHYDYQPDQCRSEGKPASFRKPCSVIAALQDGARLLVWDAARRATETVVLNAGDVLVFDGDVGHAGADYHVGNTRVHVYLDVPSVDRDPDNVWYVV